MWISGKAIPDAEHRFPTWDADWDTITLSPTSTVRGWETLAIIVG
ncbi:cytochrome P450 [Nocardia africana]|nr:cytochrome P450 [Nocardia africana]MCC3314869.1 cytochrome P450 [Nocardia africana]